MCSLFFIEVKCVKLGWFCIDVEVLVKKRLLCFCFVRMGMVCFVVRKVLK